MSTKFLGVTLHQTTALALAIGALGVGSFIATAVGAGMSIKRPLWLQAIGIVAVAVAALAALIFYSLTFVVILCLVTAIASGLAKLAVDASIQERIPENVRASAFAHSETLLMLAWVVGGAIGLIPFSGRIGMIVCTIGIAVSAARAVLVAMQLRNERLSGISNDSTVSMSGPSAPAPVTTPVTGPTATAPAAAGTTRQLASRGADHRPAAKLPHLAATVARHDPADAEDEGQPLGASQDRPATPLMSCPRRRSNRSRTDVLPRGQDDQPSYHLYRPVDAGRAANEVAGRHGGRRGTTGRCWTGGPQPRRRRPSESECPRAAAHTAFVLARAETAYDAVVSTGIAGGFDGRAAIGETVIATRTVAGDLGAESPDGFLTVDELGFGTSALDTDPQLRQLLAAAAGQRARRCDRVGEHRDRHARRARRRWSPGIPTPSPRRWRGTAPRARRRP